VRDIFQYFARKLQHLKIHIITGAVFHGNITKKGAGLRCDDIIVALKFAAGLQNDPFEIILINPDVF